MQKEYLTPDDVNTLRTIAVGRVVSSFMERSKNEVEHLVSGIPYAIAVLALMRGEEYDEECVAIIRQKIATTAHLGTASWDEAPLEEIVIICMADLHSTYRTLHPLDSKEELELVDYLPLAYIGWEKVAHYYAVIQPILEVLQAKIEIEDLRQAYYEYAASEFYKYGFCDAVDYQSAIHAIATVNHKISGIPVGLCRDILSHPQTTMLVYQSIKNNGFGEFECMKNLALRYNAECGKTTRQELIKKLLNIVTIV